jgi:hypothetical protein
LLNVPEPRPDASVLNFHLGGDDDLRVSVSFRRKYAIGVAALGAALIAVLATQAVPLPTVWRAILVIFVLVCVGGGLFCLGLTRRHRADTPRGYQRVVAGLGVFFLVIGSLAFVALVEPSAARWTFLAIGCLLIARGVAFKIALHVLKRRNVTATG